MLPVPYRSYPYMAGTPMASYSRVCMIYEDSALVLVFFCGKDQAIPLPENYVRTPYHREGDWTLTLICLYM